MSSVLRSDLDHSKQLGGRHTGLRVESVRPVRYHFSHQAIERRSLMLHQRVAEKILENNQYFTFAHTTLSKLLLDETHPARKYFLEWESIMRQGIASTVKALQEEGEVGNARRTSSPFAGILSQAERSAVYEEWKRLHEKK